MSSYPVAESLVLPISLYQVSGYHFGQRVRSRWILWARHLGDDILADPGTAVTAIGRGKVVYAGIRPGSPARHNWGGLVVVGHSAPQSDAVFFSVYGHITDLQVALDQEVTKGQTLGIVAAGLTAANGWWALPHLHFGVYAGPWREGEIVPGYKRPFDGRTRFKWWRDPQVFIREYQGV